MQQSSRQGAVKVHVIANQEDWLEDTGEVELVAGWAQVALSADFTALADTTSYQVFLTSYDAVALFVQNRTQQSFEIHAMNAPGGRRPFATRCGYRIMARRLKPRR